MRQTIALFIVVFSFSIPTFGQMISVSSPDKNITFQLSDNEGLLTYQVSYLGEVIIAESALGMAFKEQASIGQQAKIENSQDHTVKQTWEQPWGEQQYIVDHHNAAIVTITDINNSRYRLHIKVFNDGLGFRYEFEQVSSINQTITNELTEFYLADNNAIAWWIPARGWNRYEYLYNTSSLNKIDRAHTPITFKYQSGVHVSIHEASLVDYAAMSLDQQRPGVFKADLAPWSDGSLVKTNGSFKTPWRTIQIAKNASGLINSTLILNLNEPNKLGDVSWVKPGKYVGIWWGMHLAKNTWGSGAKHGATTDETIRYMDFAAEHNFSGVLVEGWNIGWDGSWFKNGDVFSFTQAYDDFDLAKISQHGLKKGVQLIGHHETSGSVTNYRNQMSSAYDLYQLHNVSQVKTGYVADGGKIKRIDENGIARNEWHDGQFMVNEYLHSITEAAKRKISINTHEPIKDTGLRRTYPNWISREGARGQEYNAWGNPPNTPEHTTILPFTRMLAGPMDFTPGIFDMSFNGLGEHSNRPQTTLAKQLALYVVIYSPIQMAADLPENYQKNLSAFQFIKDVTTDWQQSIALAGEVGEFVVIARQAKHNDDWFLGAITDENKRELSFPLTFLDKTKRYQAEIYQDGKTANWQLAPYEIDISSQEVTYKSTLNLNLATSGGTAIRFKAL